MSRLTASLLSVFPRLLPKGNFRVFTNRENGVPAYLGEDRVDNLAVDLPADIKVSNSIAVQMQSRIEGVTTGQGHAR